MLGALLRALIVVVLIVAAAAFFLGYRFGDGPGIEVERTGPVVGTSGSRDVDVPDVDTSKAREKGAEVGEKLAVAANTAKEAIEDGALTAKIKSKMALDDTVKALNIDVDTLDGVVTLTGVVRSDAERQRAVALARETDGVKKVDDRLTNR